MDAAAIARADAELERRLNEMPSPTGLTQRLPLRLDRMPHHLRDEILADRERRRRRAEEELERKRAVRKQKEREERRERKRQRRERRERERKEREPDDELEDGEIDDKVEEGEIRDEPAADDQKPKKPKPDRKKKKKKKSKHRDREEAAEPKDGAEPREPEAKRKKAKKKKRKDREKADGDEPAILEQKGERKKKKKKRKEPKAPKESKKPAEPEDADKPSTSASTSTATKPPKPAAMLMTSTPKASRKPAVPKKPLAAKKPPVKPPNRRDPRHPLNQKKKPPKKRLDHDELRAARRAMRKHPGPDIAQILRLPAPLHQPLMEAMEEVRHHREIPADERRLIRGFLNFKGDLIATLSEYREMEIDTTLTDHQLDKKYEMMERHRAKLQQKLRDVCKWLRQRIEFQDGEEPEDSTDDEGEVKPKPLPVVVTCTQCERLNTLLTTFSTFIITMTADIKRHVRGARYDQWADVALLNGKTDAEHEAADRTPGLFGAARPGADEEFQQLRANTIETLRQLNAEAEAEQDGGGLSIDDIRDGMIALDESEGDENDSELTTASSDIVTINSTTDDEDQLLRNVTAAIEQTADDVVEVNGEEEQENGEAEGEVEAGEAEEVEVAAPSIFNAPSTSTAPAPPDDSPRPPAVVIASGRESQRQLRAQLAERKRQSGGEEDDGVNDVVPPDPFPAGAPNATAVDSQLSRRSANSSDISLAGSDGAPPFKRSRSRMPEESEEEAGIDDQLPLLADDQPAAVAPLDDSVEIIEIDDDSDSDIVCLN
ncbi:hypothetical protein M3Y99_00984700 [Aphelenchoides fujianensis]|nr:hypothetical protein M3Y99_00984700 [Aphelenchoides fujianensis]